MLIPLKLQLFLASLVMLAAVAIGAFGAHALRDLLQGRAGEVFHTASNYHFYHGLALFLPAICEKLGLIPVGASNLVFLLFLVGLIIFSGSLYALSISGIKWFGAITPIGGTFLLIGWGIMAWKTIK